MNGRYLKIVAGCFMGAVLASGYGINAQASELSTDMPSAGIAVALQQYYGESETKEAASEKDDTSDQADSEETETQTEEKDTFGIGEVAEMNDIQVTMVNYTESEGSEYNKPSDGNEFVLVEFEIANNSDSEMTVSSMASFEAYADDYALNYSLNAAVDNQDSNQLDGTIAAGKKMNGVIGYEVPKDWKNLEIHFTDNVWSSNKFKFEITR